MFLTTMILFIVLAVAQAFVTSVALLVVIRSCWAFRSGAIFSNGYTYIMESMPKGQREVMGNRWQFMFADRRSHDAGRHLRLHRHQHGS